MNTNFCPIRSTPSQEVPCRSTCAWNTCTARDGQPACAVVSLAALADNTSMLPHLADAVTRLHPRRP